MGIVSKYLLLIKKDVIFVIFVVEKDENVLFFLISNWWNFRCFNRFNDLLFKEYFILL